MSKEKEELADIIAKEIREGQTAYTVAKKIQQLGYTKTHFPIEKLEKWLGKLKGDWGHQEKQDHIEKALCEMIINTLQAVEDKIQELKGDIEVDNNG